MKITVENIQREYERCRVTQQWQISRDVYNKIISLKDDQGNYLYTPPPLDIHARTLMGLPIKIVEGENICFLVTSR